MKATFSRTIALFLFLYFNCSIDLVRAFEVSAKATVNFNQVTPLSVTPQAFGANIVLSSAMSDPAYQNVMKQMDWPLLRVNGQDSLLGYTFYSRDAATGKVAPNWFLVDRMKYIPSFAKGRILITPGGPPDPTRFSGWASAPFNMLNSDDQALYASMVSQIADRLKAFNVPVTHWSLFNEPNIAWYSSQLSYSQLIQSTCTIARLTYSALKKNDSSYIIGGPELDYWGTNASWLADYMSCAAPVTQFVSYHTYGINTENKYDVQSMIKGILGLDPSNKRNYRSGAVEMSQLAHSISPTMPLMLSEYSMNGAWQPSDPLQSTVTGAVYDALAISQAVSGGATATAIWEAFDDQTFGVIDSKFQMRPAAYILKAMRQFLPGRVVASSLTNVDKSQVLNGTLFATTGASHSTIMIVNYDNTSNMRVQITQNGRSPTKVQRYELSDNNPRGTVAMISIQNLNSIYVPANSVVILTLSST